MKFYFVIDFEGDEQIYIDPYVVEDIVKQVIALRPRVYGEVFIEVIDQEGERHRYADYPQHVN